MKLIYNFSYPFLDGFFHPPKQLLEQSDPLPSDPFFDVNETEPDDDEDDDDDDPDREISVDEVDDPEREPSDELNDELDEYLSFLSSFFLSHDDLKNENN